MKKTGNNLKNTMLALLLGIFSIASLSGGIQAAKAVGAKCSARYGYKKKRKMNFVNSDITYVDNSLETGSILDSSDNAYIVFNTIGKRIQQQVGFLIGSNVKIEEGKTYPLYGVADFNSDRIVFNYDRIKYNKKRTKALVHDSGESSVATGSITFTRVDAQRSYIEATFEAKIKHFKYLVKRNKKGKTVATKIKVVTSNFTSGHFSDTIHELRNSYFRPGADFLEKSPDYLPTKSYFVNDANAALAVAEAAASFRIGDRIYVADEEDIQVNPTAGRYEVAIDLSDRVNGNDSNAKLQFTIRDMHLDEDDSNTFKSVDRGTFGTQATKSNPPTPYVLFKLEQSHDNQKERIVFLERNSQSFTNASGNMILTTKDMSTGHLVGTFENSMDTTFKISTYESGQGQDEEYRVVIQEGKFDFYLWSQAQEEEEEVVEEETEEAQAFSV